VGEEPDDKVLVLADPLDAISGRVGDLYQWWWWVGLADSRSLRLAHSVRAG
jgi:hypothetical protein